MIEGEALANDLLLLLSFSATVTALLLLSVNPDDWVLRKRRNYKGAQFTFTHEYCVH